MGTATGMSKLAWPRLVAVTSSDVVVVVVVIVVSCREAANNTNATRPHKQTTFVPLLNDCGVAYDVDEGSKCIGRVPSVGFEVASIDRSSASCATHAIFRLVVVLFVFVCSCSFCVLCCVSCVYQTELFITLLHFARLFSPTSLLFHHAVPRKHRHPEARRGGGGQDAQAEAPCSEPQLVLHGRAMPGLRADVRAVFGLAVSRLRVAASFCGFV